MSGAPGSIYARSSRPVRRAHTLLLIAWLAAVGCVGPWSANRGGEDVADAVDRLAGVVSGIDRPGSIAVVGFRDESGERTAATQILDEALISSLVRAQLPLEPVISMEGRWLGSEPIDPKAIRDADGEIVIGGRMQEHGDWVWVQLFAVDRTGRLLASGDRRIPSRQMEREVERRGADGIASYESSVVAAELHLLGLRRVGAFEEQLPIEANGVLEPDDRLQIRFEVEYDCRVWSFLYSSTGGVRTLFGNQTVYSGREHFGPGENQWITAGESGEVYTLYFIVGRSLEEETTELFDEMAKLIEQNEIDRYKGFEKLDEVLRGFLEERLEDGGTVDIVSNLPEASLTEPVRYLPESGTELVTRGEKLGPETLILRALRFEVL